MTPRFFHQGMYERPANATPLIFLRNSDRADLGKVHSIEMESPAADDLPFLFGHDEIPNVFGQLRNGSRKQDPFGRVMLDDCVNVLHVGEDGSAGS